MMQSFLIALLVLLALALFAAFVGAMLAPERVRPGDAGADAWVPAERCGNEDLANTVSLGLPSGEALPAAGRMYVSRRERALGVGS